MVHVPSSSKELNTKTDMLDNNYLCDLKPHDQLYGGMNKFKLLQPSLFITSYWLQLTQLASSYKI